ncbi:MAG TPA: tetratricopeptide repeat protein [Actinomycetes bacterium]|nr:tetratricopeptide repeat protein [Actinomycetes bacterium]
METTAISPPAPGGEPAAQRRRSLRPVAILLVTVLMGLGLGRFALAGSDGRDDAAQPPPRARAETATAAVSRLQAQLREQPDQPRLLTQLGLAQLARARETADPSAYGAAEQALERARRLQPGDPGTLTGLGTLALARHDFSQALTWGEQARRVAPDATEPLAVIADAQVELGRYPQATATVQTMVDRRPDLRSLSRVSYLRELHGDHAGAVTAMLEAAVAGAGAPADRAYVRTLVGDLHLAAGQLDKARAAYEQAVAEDPTASTGRPGGPGSGYAPAEVGLARVAAARGDLAGAAARLRPVVERRPEPGSVALLGDLEAALGHGRAASAQYGLVRAIEQLNRTNGVAVDLELARFEADHARDRSGDPARAVALARAAMRQRPTIFAADTLGWALRQAGRAREALPHARAAVRLGTLDAQLWYHLASVEAELGRTAPARTHLARALRLNPYLTVRDLPEARRLAGRLGLPAPAGGADR